MTAKNQYPARFFWSAAASGNMEERENAWRNSIPSGIEPICPRPVVKGKKTLGMCSDTRIYTTVVNGGSALMNYAFLVLVNFSAFDASMPMKDGGYEDASLPFCQNFCLPDHMDIQYTFIHCRTEFNTAFNTATFLDFPYSRVIVKAFP
ncbi:MAG: hypothetical protein LBC94_05995 [Desulfovibrio sp.]|nr:hypothetical protein [Desulfovibrio sp.]